MMDYETIFTEYLTTGHCSAIRWETCVMCPVAVLCGAWIVDPVQMRESMARYIGENEWNH